MRLLQMRSTVPVPVLVLVLVPVSVSVPVPVAVAAMVPVFAFSATPTSASAAVRTLPDPCALTPAKLIGPALGVKVATKNRLSETTVDKIAQDRRAWVHASISLFVSVTRYQASSGSGGVPGMAFERRPAGLGSQGRFVYDRNPKCLFSGASFAKAGYSVIVYSHGPDCPSSVLALARAVYSAMP
jgi:hypothetical protein